MSGPRTGLLCSQNPKAVPVAQRGGADRSGQWALLGDTRNIIAGEISLFLWIPEPLGAEKAGDGGGGKRPQRLTLGTWTGQVLSITAKLGSQNVLIQPCFHIPTPSSLKFPGQENTKANTSISWEKIYQRKRLLYLFSSIAVIQQGLFSSHWVCHSLRWLELEGSPLSSQSMEHKESDKAKALPALQLRPEVDCDKLPEGPVHRREAGIREGGLRSSRSGA